MRIAIGSYIQESHSFAPTVGRWDEFRAGQLSYGQDMLEGVRGTRTEVAGAIDVATRYGQRNGQLELVPTLRAMQSSSTGPIVRAVHEALRDDLVARIRAAGELDGVFLAMHGAMSAETYDDATGDVLRAVREVIGPHVPLVCTLDLHANITRRMAAASDALVGYLTFPHIDLYETGARGMRLLVHATRTKVKPVNLFCKLPMIVPAENAQTTRGVIHDLLQSALAEVGHDGILDVSIFPMQPWLDVPEAGCAVVAVAEPAHVADAELLVNTLAESWWLRRDEHRVALADTRAIIAQALASERAPWILADSADAPSSGAPGDSTVTLEALLAARPDKPCLTNIVDPAAVGKMAAAGTGSEVTLTLGASSGTSLYKPITVTGRVRLISDGDFTHKGQGLYGQVMHRGRTAVLQCGQVFVVVMERACLQWDRELYRSVGLAPEEAHIVIVKSPAGFRADYEPIAAEVHVLDAPGVCTPNLQTLPFKRIPRPMHPFDAVTTR